MLANFGAISGNFEATWRANFWAILKATLGEPRGATSGGQPRGNLRRLEATSGSNLRGQLKGAK